MEESVGRGKGQGGGKTELSLLVSVWSMNRGLLGAVGRTGDKQDERGGAGLEIGT